MARAAVSDAEVSFDVVAPANAAGEARQAKAGDESISLFGRFLRRRSLDEFPQFWNGLVGDMSVAEPRRYTPEPNGAFRRRTRGYRSRQLVKPGITGLAVVSGEFSKKADYGKWFGAKAKNHQRKEYHDPPKAER